MTSKDPKMKILKVVGVVFSPVKKANSYHLIPGGGKCKTRRGGGEIYESRKLIRGEYNRALTAAGFFASSLANGQLSDGET